MSFRIDSIAELARQMGFTPRETRLTQLSAAEQLLGDLDPAKAYPLDFVVFRITGYHPRRVAAGDLLPGAALQHDLGLLIEKVSDALGESTAATNQPVLTIEDVTATFNVTSKTIQRWRRRGLPARRFVFPDGKRRVGFLLSSVERFLAVHRDQVERGANFTLLADAECRQILRHARRLAEQGGLWPEEIARRIGRRLRRSPLTILHTLRKHDELHPQDAVLPRAGKPFSEDERALVLKGQRRGLTLAAVARRLGRSRTAVYRVLLEERIARLNRKKIRFIDDELYHQPDAAAAIEQILAQEAVGEQSRAEDGRVPRDLPPYLQELWRTPLLTPARERGLFLKLNFHRYQFVTARRKLDVESASRRDLSVLERHLKLATETRNAIVRANLRLVVSVARKHLRPGLNLMELISDGNLTLMRAVDGFDIHKGNRFSTYATFALMKGFARSVPQMLASSSSMGRQAVVGNPRALEDIADPRPTQTVQRLIERDQVRQLLSRLDERERGVLQAHYGLADGEAVTTPATYEQLGRRLGLSTQRIRQIERTAIAKLRAAATAPVGQVR